MTDEEVQELRRAALAGDEDALLRLEAHLRRESEPAPGAEEPKPTGAHDAPPMPDLPGGDTTIGDRMREIALSPNSILGTAIGVGLASLAMRALGDTQGATAGGRAVRRVLGLHVPDLPDSAAPRRRPATTKKRRKKGVRNRR